MKLLFQTHNYTVTYAGETIQLLRKEFSLLQYLFNHANHPFTREELLDAVWPLETPSDRTVDDHIYRLRKKLYDWNHFLTIDTVKGYGYQLTLHHVENSSPLAYDEEFKQLSSNLVYKYHLFGQGEAINTLLQQESLGIEVDQGMRASLAFMKGDIRNFIHTEDIPFSEKVLFLFHIYIMITNQPYKVITYYEKAIEKNVFSSESRDEAIILSPIIFYILARDFNKAKNKLVFADRSVTQEHGFYSFLQLNHMMFHMCLNEPSKVKLIINHLNDFFSKKPYQRELGLFHVLNGLFHIQQNKNKQGKEYIDKGLNMTQKTRFKSHLLLAIKVCLFMLEHYIKEPDLQHEIKEKWSNLNKEHNFIKLETEIEQQLRNHI